MDRLDTREWLLTNGLGSFASGTISDAHTRTYHGWLVAALAPPGQRTLLLARIDAVLEVAGHSFELGVNFWKSGAVAPQGFRLLQSFEPEPVPTWVWGQNHWQLSRCLLMPYGLIEPMSLDRAASRVASGKETPDSVSVNQSPVESLRPAFKHRLLIQYRYEGQEPAVLKLRPLIGDRTFHYQQRDQDNLRFAQSHQPSGVLFQAKRQSGIPWQLTWTRGNYYADGMWYWGYRYPEETQRGLADTEDLYSPGCLVVQLAPGETVTLEARVCAAEGVGEGGEAGEGFQFDTALDDQSFERALTAEQQRLSATSAHLAKSSDSDLFTRLLKAGDQFLVYRASTNGPTVIAGYPWFSDWGRDTLIALPGLTLTTKRFELAKGLLRTFGQHCEQGLIPNAFPDTGAKPFHNAIDAALWWIETLGLYLEASQDWAFLAEQYPVVWGIYKRLMAGTLYGIRVDVSDGLVTWDAPDVALTWMDAVVAGKPVTPRRGKPIEINALWYSALCWAEQWANRLQHDSFADADLTSPTLADSTMLSNQARRYANQAEQVKASLQKFWQPALGYLCDAIRPDDLPDPTIRPNAVIALSLRHCPFPDAVGQSVLRVAQTRLLTPYGLRSLDPADLRYIGYYRGGIWQRDQAYHQGTVWPWLIGPFIRAWQRFYPSQPVPFDWQPLLEHFQHQACLDSISEMFDGEPPHLPKGAIAQAWSVAEVIRHWREG